MWFLRVLGVLIFVKVLFALGPYLVVGALVLVFYGLGTASRWGWR
jgi:hypothetical protein